MLALWPWAGSITSREPSYFLLHNTRPVKLVPRNGDRRGSQGLARARRVGRAWGARGGGAHAQARPACFLPRSSRPGSRSPVALKASSSSASGLASWAAASTVATFHNYHHHPPRPPLPPKAFLVQEGTTPGPSAGDPRPPGPARLPSIAPEGPPRLGEPPRARPGSLSGGCLLPAGRGSLGASC